MTPAPLTVLAPMRIEARAVRTGAPGTRLVTTGMGPRRAREWGRRVPVGPAAVLGLAGGLGRGVRPGDVVVATSVGDGRDSLELPDPRLLAAALRRAGLRAHLGPVASSERLVTGAERGRLAAAGALAADMESFWLLRHHQGPATVVRAVLDTAAEDLLTGVPVNALVAYRSLQAAAPVVAAWGRAVRPRTVLLAGPRSFCAGVERAIDIVERAIDRFGPPVYVRRQIVHNRHVVERLERRGAVFVMELDEVPEQATTVLAAHGVARHVRDEAADRCLRVIDATCPLVSKVHAEARRFARGGYDIVLVGHRDHEEVQGTLGEVPGIRLVEGPDDVESVEVGDPERVAFLTQTTLATDEVADTVERLRRRFPSLTGPAAADICYATQNRQEAVRALAGECDVMIVVGSANSSNSNRLVEVAERSGCPARLVDDWSELDLGWLAGAATVGVTAGASAPADAVTDVVGALAGLGPVDVLERRVATEDVAFALPGEVR